MIENLKTFYYSRVRKNSDPKKEATASEMGTEEKRHSTAVIFLIVDIDGVINIGISDRCSGALSCTTGNIAAATNMPEEQRLQSSSAQKLLSVSTRKAEEKMTYGELCKGPGQLSEVYIRRLAEVIAAAKTQGKLVCVLSSTWRTKNVRGVQMLQEGVSKHLGESWAFDAHTGAKELGTPSGRLENIGRFTTEWVAKSAETLDSVRVLVLEDFHITPLDGWKCGTKSICSTEDVEVYLRECLPQNMDVSTRLIHTFDQWESDNGKRIVLQVGCGLSMKHFHNALAFLGFDTHALGTDAGLPPSEDPDECPDSPLPRRNGFSRGFRGAWAGAEGFTSDGIESI